MRLTAEVDLVLAGAEATPDRIAVRMGAEALTYARLADDAARVAGGLRAAGVEGRERVGLLLDSSPDFVRAYFGIQWYGAVVLPLSPREPARAVRCLGRAGVRTVIARSEATRELLATCAPTVPRVLPLHTLLATPPLSTPHCADLEDVSVIVFTTGTTAVPKGVVLRHRNTLAAMHGIVDVMGLEEGVIEVMPMPLHLSFGLARLRCVLARRGTLVLAAGVVFPRQVFDLVRSTGAHGFAAVPAAWEILLGGGAETLAQAFSGLAHAELGSAPMPAGRKRELAARLPTTRLWMHYGLTEASRSTFMEFHADGDALDTIGRPLSGVRVSIRDEQGAAVEPGGSGEICIAGPTVFAGYMDDPEATAAAFWGPWFRTGDLGRQAPDGRFYLTGRIKELINLGGTKVSPSEIEQVLDACPGVAESAVVGVPRCQAVTGEEIHAFVVTRAGAPLEPADVLAFVSERLDPLRRPVQVHLVPTLPRTPSGKIQRLALREQVS